jgi:dihydropteroate synthase
MKRINCKGKLLDLETPAVMGIINATPDSFYQGHLQSGPDEIVTLAARMISEGASILDIGGQSTRPGSERISAQEETDRVIPVIERIHQVYPGMILSIDTYSSEVAKAAVAAGASIVNDISGGNMDAEMIPTVAALKVPYICMHMQGTPGTMQHAPAYKDLLKEIIDFFIERLDTCTKAGITDLIIDPGFGFGKTIEHNFSLLKELAAFSIFNRPVLAGISRKSTIYRTLGVSADEALNGTTVLNSMALMNGANILRVHDVKQAYEAVQLYTAYKKAP